jgi:uncharacterized protein YeeX (DUF496 family)
MDPEKKQLKKEIADLNNKIKDLNATIATWKNLAKALEQQSHHYELMAERLRKEITGLRWLEEKISGTDNLEKAGPKL